MHDYVIVGAGSAGCVLANRLSEDPSVRVLLLEAGGRDRSPNIKIPAAFPKQFHTKLDWDYATEPEPYVDARSLYVPRGKSLGGSSSMNAMLYVRGRPLDYDALGGAGRDRLGLQGRAPLLHEVRGQRARSIGVPRRGRAAARLRAALAAPAQPPPARTRARRPGIPQIADYNGPEQDGVVDVPGHAARTAGASAPPTRSCARPSPARTSRCARDASVLGVELEGTARSACACAEGAAARSSCAPGEVMLCAGAINSPQLLLLSGIGPADELRAVGVEPFATSFAASGATCRTTRSSR